MTDEQWYWLGHTQTGDDTNRIPLPASIQELEIAEADDQLVWGYDTEHDAVTIFQDPEAIDDDSRFRRYSQSRIHENMVIPIPEDALKEHSWVGCGMQLHLVASSAMVGESRCLLLPEDDARDRFGEMIGGE